MLRVNNNKKNHLSGIWIFLVSLLQPEGHRKTRDVCKHPAGDLHGWPADAPDTVLTVLRLDSSDLPSVTVKSEVANLNTQIDSKVNSCIVANVKELS